MTGRILLFTLILVQSATPQSANRLKSTTGGILGADTAGRLWVKPADIEVRNLLYGSGGESQKPKSTQFEFVKEDTGGSSPKFTVKDADGVEWKVKLGAEAHSEVAAARLVWAAGYFTRDYYFMPSMSVESLPRLHRGNEYVRDGRVLNARVMREWKNAKKVSDWSWMESPFLGTREFNMLRALMSLINNWDLKDVNNAIYDEQGRHIYMVADLGAAFGTSGIVKGRTASRGNLEAYRSSEFIQSILPDMVDFAAPARPQWTELVTPLQYIRRTHMRWIGDRVPRQDAAALGQLLSRLSPGQIRDAFRAAGYSAEDVEGFAQVVEGRIGALQSLTIRVQ